jgi:hypothetical protein
VGWFLDVVLVEIIPFIVHNFEGFFEGFGFVEIFAVGASTFE